MRQVQGHALGLVGGPAAGRTPGADRCDERMLRIVNALLEFELSDEDRRWRPGTAKIKGRTNRGVLVVQKRRPAAERTISVLTPAPDRSQARGCILRPRSAEDETSLKDMTRRARRSSSSPRPSSGSASRQRLPRRPRSQPAVRIPAPTRPRQPRPTPIPSFWYFAAQSPEGEEHHGGGSTATGCVRSSSPANELHQQHVPRAGGRVAEKQEGPAAGDAQRGNWPRGARRPGR